jgi:putative heme-binding domain-containing protein
MKRSSLIPGWWSVVRALGNYLFAIACFGLQVPSAMANGSPEAELASFRVLDGFEVTLFASETNDVVKPIQIRFDPDGRLWVAGSVTYPQIVPGTPANDYIVVLEDRDGDGRAERSTVFADGLQIPTGLELGDGGVYVGAATELLHLRDTDGDGRADERRVVLSGFGTGDAHQTLNSLTWGPSGELLMSQGLHANSRIETPWGIEQLRQAGVWRFWPRHLRLDAFWDGAMGAHNPFGNVFDRWGQPFVFAGNGHGIYHLTQAMIRTDHFLEQKSIWNQGRKFGGADVVENSLWPAAYQGEFLAGGYLQNTVERFRMSENGATFTAERLPALIESSDTAFRIVDARFGPDGALYLCDWYNPVIGHYQTSFRHPDRDKTRGRIWRVLPRGAGLKRPPAMTPRSTDDLVVELDSPERWNRQMAHRVLAARPAGEVADAVRRRLNDATESPPPTDLLLFELLGVLTDHGITEPNLLQRLAKAPTFDARAYAARVTGQWASRLPQNGAAPEINLILDQLTTLAADPQPRVRLEAIVACSYVRDSRAVEVAAIATDQPMSSPVEYAFTQCVQALKPWWRPAAERGDLKFGGVATRLTAFTKADRSGDTVAKAAGRLRRIAEVALDGSTQRDLLQAVADAGGPGELGVLLSPRAFTVGTYYDANLQADFLRRLSVASRNRNVRPDGNLVPPLTELITSPSVPVRAAALSLAGQWQLEALRPAVEKAAADAAQPVLQAAAIAGIAGFGNADSIRQLKALSAPPSSLEIRVTAVAALVPLDVSAAGVAAATLLSTPLDSTLTRALLTVFLQQREAVRSLVNAITTTPPSAESARTALELMASSGRRDPILAALFARVAGLAESVSAPPRLEDIPELSREVRESGNRERGAQVFHSSALGCTACHSVDGSPGKVGPNLSALGTAQTVEYVLGAMIDPQKEVKEGFVAYEIVTLRGDTYQGYFRGETDDEVVILDHLTGQPVRLSPGQIADRRQLGSLMPSGLLDSLSRTEIRDLTAYLSGLGRRE